MGTLHLVTGPSGSGKTTYCLQRLAEAQAIGINARGLLSPGYFVAGEKKAIHTLDVSSGEKRPLATLATPGSLGTLGMRWTFNDETLAWGEQILSKAVPTNWLFLDELGPLELVHAKGWSVAIEIVTGGAYEQAWVTIRPALLEKAQALWPDAKVIAVRSESD